MAEQQAEQAGAQEPGRQAAEQPAAEQSTVAAEQAAAASGQARAARWAGRSYAGTAMPTAPVDVDGGAEKLRLPRLPELKPPPTRASAGAARTTSVVATANIAINARKPKRNIWASRKRPPPEPERFGLCLKSYAILGCDGT